jgi:hypothetical protein
VKILRILFANLLLILLIYFSCEYITYKNNLNNEIKNNGIVITKKFFYNLYSSPLKNFKKAVIAAEKFETDSNRIVFRKLENPPEYDKNKSSILLYGCSYTYGVILKDNETFSYHLQKITKRLVYNRALQGYGIQHMLYLLENTIGLFKQHSDYIEPEIIIYTFIEDHVLRLYQPNDFFDIYLMFYKYDKDKKYLKEFNEFDIYYWHSYILRNFNFNHGKNPVEINNSEEKFLSSEAAEFVKLHFLQAYKNIQQYFSGSRFVIFVYNGDFCIRQIEDELKEKGIEIVYLSDLSQTNFLEGEYVIYDGFHPSAKAWEEITPLLVKKLNL